MNCANLVDLGVMYKQRTISEAMNCANSVNLGEMYNQRTVREAMNWYFSVVKYGNIVIF